MKGQSILFFTTIIMFQSVVLFGQQKKANNETGIVKMSPNELVSLAKTLKKNKEIRIKKWQQAEALKKQNLQIQQATQSVLQQINDLEIAITTQLNTPKKSTDSSLKTKLALVKSHLNTVKLALNKPLTNTVPDLNLLVIPEISTLKNNPKQNTNNTQLVNLNKKIDSINHQITDLKLIQNKTTAQVVYLIADKDSTLQNFTLKTNKTSVIEKTESNTLTGYKLQLFFENNKSSVGKAQLKKIYELINLVELNKDVFVFINGYASNTGSKKYNQFISLMRTEAVKKVLIEKGIPVTKILTQPNGIDKKAVSNEMARRVDITLIKNN